MTPSQSRNLRRELAAVKLITTLRVRLGFRSYLGAEETVELIILAIAEHDAECASIEAEVVDEREGVAA